MDNQEEKAELSKINDYLNRCLWMDFEVCQMSFISIEIAGRVDTSVNKYAISIIFEYPTFIQGTICWNLDNSRSFIEKASKEEFIEINKKYQIEKGSILFKIYMEDFEESAFYIASKGIKSNIYIENPLSCL